ncbi:MAG: two-component system, OmpR family, alkaline phosphatase synthesis response regulator PhoP [Acidobacteriota bacterium]|nr:two-component system, OmpR family, alkaline phosphatase synthesis response regulator PhoP [Acidobacteriota bacterium]
MSYVLIVEDEKHLAAGLRFNLEAEGYAVETVGDGESALALLLTERRRFDVIVLDVMLPGADGFTVAAELRQAGSFVPVLMLTARGQPEDVLRGFESGADDYLAKPFELSVLIARINGLLRRREWFHRDRENFAPAPVPPEREASPVAGRASDRPGSPSDRPRRGSRPAETENDVFAFGGKTIDFGALELRTGDRALRLTLMEAELLRHLVRHAGQVVSRKSLLEEVWGLHEDTDTRAIDNFVVRIRKYIEAEPSRPRHLLTVRGVGYRFVAETIEHTP